LGGEHFSQQDDDNISFNAHAGESYGEILAHPIFFKPRAPFAPPSPPPAAPPPAPPPPVAIDPGLVVGGVVIKDNLAKAFLFSKSGSIASAWVSQGEMVQGKWFRDGR